MPIHKFTVNVPNPTARRVVAQLRLERTKQKAFPTVQRKPAKGELKIISAGFALEPCITEVKRTLTLKMEPFASVDIYVVINTAPSSKPGTALFHVVDRRGNKDVGGVMLVCIVPPYVEPPGQTVSTPNPCSASLATALYAVPSGEDPSKRSAAKPIIAGQTVDLVAQITNSAKKSLVDTQVYLEHLGLSDAEFVPGTWNVGTLNSVDIFYAIWPIHPKVWRTGNFNASIVVLSKGTDPVRLAGVIKVTPPKKG